MATFTSCKCHHIGLSTIYNLFCNVYYGFKFILSISFLAIHALFQIFHPRISSIHFTNAVFYFSMLVLSSGGLCVCGCLFCGFHVSFFLILLADFQ